MNRRAKLRAIVDSVKLSRGCENPDCGWSIDFTPEMLEFDHINPNNKYKAVAKLVSEKHGLPTIYKEIDKCIVLCSNCHKQKTRVSCEHLS